MKNVNILISSALASALAFGASSAFAADKPEMEKCYGVVKEGKNDCKTASSACAGHSTSDGQADAFIAVPKGTCERIVGGSLSSGK